MGYLICQECGGYYKLEKGESKEDFVSCECYGSLTYIDAIDDYLNENNKFNKDLSGDTGNDSSDVKYAVDVKSDNLVQDSDSPSRTGFEGELTLKKEISESLSFPSFRESEDIPSVKNRNYYRKISSNDIKPDIKKLKLIKDVNGVIEALSYDDLEVKLEAVQALGAMGDERALKYLDKLRTEETGVLKTYAENAIFHIESKNKGLKSQNRAYYREEYYKGITITSDEKKLIDQTKKPIDQTVTTIKEKVPDKTSEIPKNSVSGVQNILDTKTRSTQKTAKLPGKTDGTEVNSKEVPKLVVPSEIVKTNISKKTTPKNDETKRITETEGTSDDGIYFIQFLGIKKTDKPLIGFIFFFTVSLGIGVLLTMGYK
ncbi:HEAT repeat domain-containing protein [Methanobacterium sp.]|uniref:HEAT repeat domain-containing protein n=1 Tax=Methanobacterium sp. TaxID=2164 RepID=UPI002AB9EFCD|nr:HEAT repeat domain-containing protein [Methanobacterium sp.]MDY9923081.1 HEAT repeat domain-containing protein [Methanobacterium sp.]